MLFFLSYQHAHFFQGSGNDGENDEYDPEDDADADADADDDKLLASLKRDELVAWVDEHNIVPQGKGKRPTMKGMHSSLSPVCIFTHNSCRSSQGDCSSPEIRATHKGGSQEHHQ